MNNNKEVKETNIKQEESKLGFFEKLRTNKKYRAKIELISYGILILIIIIYANFSSINNNNYNYTKDTNTSADNEKTKDTVLYNEIKDDYKANITVTTIKDGLVSNRKYEVIKENTETIVNILDNNTQYKLSDTGEFYTSDNILTEESQIFDLVSYKYLDFSNIKKYISKGTVDYTTKYSSGLELTSYKILLRDLLLDNTTDEYITINVTNEQAKVIMDIDYTALLKSNIIDSCNIKIEYSDINNNIIEENSQN